ncbi:MAG: PhzF family phenazine biosynthesis protein [Brevinematia bacterium]
MKYFIVDVFCKEKYTGNQLAVVLANSSLTKNEMQVIANEFHFSETTFILGKNEQDNSYRVLIFTPKSEVPFAGHPTLGTAFIIRNEIEFTKPENIFLDLNVGKIKVSFDDKNNIQWMKQIEPEFGKIHSKNKVAELINLKKDNIDEKFPIQEVSTGINFLIIPLKNINSVKKASTNLILYKKYFKDKKPLPIFIFCPETYEKENKVNCRLFADVFGVPEDPATGSANGCLAAYLAHYKYFGSNKVDITVEQGYEINRKSILHLRSNLESNKYNIEVGGKVIKVSEGLLL